MKIIIKSFCFNKTIQKYAVCLFITFLFVVFLLNFKVSLEQKIMNLKNNIEENRIIVVEIYSENTINKFKRDKSIEKIEKLDYSYKITFKNYNDIDSFKEKYSKYLKSITSISNNDNTSIITNVTYIIDIIIYIVEFAILIILALNINQIILETKYDISLYKLIGYKNIDILRYYAIILLVFIVLFYFISLFVNLIFIFILNFVFKVINLDFILIFSYKNFFIFLLILFFSIFLILLNFRRISNISPIDLMK